MCLWIALVRLLPFSPGEADLQGLQNIVFVIHKQARSIRGVQTVAVWVEDVLGHTHETTQLRTTTLQSRNLET